MAIATNVQYGGLDELYLDPMNPRLGRNRTSRKISQEKILDIMRDFTLEELAVSFLDAKQFWTQEALLVVEEKLYGKNCLVVVEGNRRLAALLCLRNTIKRKPPSKKWTELVRGTRPPKSLFSEIPYLKVDSRKEVESFLGFRHVTGIKQWEATEKAAFIAKLIDERGMTYKNAMRKIGSTTPTVRRNYISYRLLLQIEDSVQKIPQENIDNRFSVMYLSLRTKGVQNYLHIDILADPRKARKPVPRRHLKALEYFALWLFGDEDRLPLFTDSRRVDNFGSILESTEAIKYLERSDSPHFDVAHRIAGGDLPEIVRLLEEAADNIELSLTRAHLYGQSRPLQSAVERVGRDTKQLLSAFPKVRKKLEETRR